MRHDLRNLEDLMMHAADEKIGSHLLGGLGRSRRVEREYYYNSSSSSTVLLNYTVLLLLLLLLLLLYYHSSYYYYKIVVLINISNIMQFYNKILKKY